jgi:hypothetical protein
LIRNSLHSDYLASLNYRKRSGGDTIRDILKWEEENNCKSGRLSQFRYSVNLDERMGSIFFRLLPYTSFMISLILILGTNGGRVVWGICLLFLSFSFIIYLQNYYSIGYYFVRESIFNLKKKAEIGHSRGVPVIVEGKKVYCVLDGVGNVVTFISDETGSIPVKYNLSNLKWSNYNLGSIDGDFYFAGFFRREGGVPIFEVYRVFGSGLNLFKLSCKTKRMVMVGIMVLIGVYLIATGF